MKNADMTEIPATEDGFLTGVGMTKREMIAMHCAASAFGSAAWIDSSAWKIAEQAVKQADALLAELEKQGDKQ